VAARRRLRPYRWPATEVSWITRVTLPSPDHSRWAPVGATLLNISTSGLLLSSGIQLAAGQAAVVRLAGPSTDHVLGIRVVRSQAVSHPTGISYHAAAVFNEPLRDLLPVSSSRGYSDVTAGRLADLIAYANLAAGRGMHGGELRPAVEEALKRVIPARDIRIQDVPTSRDDGTESVYFTVPTGGDPQPILQATFEPQYPVQRDEFDILEAAALLAADVIRIEHHETHAME